VAVERETVKQSPAEQGAAAHRVVARLAVSHRAVAQPATGQPAAAQEGVGAVELPIRRWAAAATAAAVEQADMEGVAAMRAMDLLAVAHVASEPMAAAWPVAAVKLPRQAPALHQRRGALLHRPKVRSHPAMWLVATSPMKHNRSAVPA
jgi:hypothetical protein